MMFVQVDPFRLANKNKSNLDIHVRGLLIKSRKSFMVDCSSLRMSYHRFLDFNVSTNHQPGMNHSRCYSASVTQKAQALLCSNASSMTALLVQRWEAFLVIGAQRCVLCFPNAQLFGRRTAWTWRSMAISLWCPLRKLRKQRSIIQGIRPCLSCMLLP